MKRYCCNVHRYFLVLSWTDSYFSRWAAEAEFVSKKRMEIGPEETQYDRARVLGYRKITVARLHTWREVCVCGSVLAALCAIWDVEW